MGAREHNQASFFPQDQHDRTNFCVTDKIFKHGSVKNGEHMPLKHGMKT